MIQYYDWPHAIENLEAVDGVDRELAYFRYSEIRNEFDSDNRYPRKFNFFMVVLCTSGHLKGRINLNEFSMESPSVIRIMPGQIVSIEEVSDDFDALVMVMSRNFIENILIYVNGNIPIGVLRRSETVINLTEDDVRVHENFFDIMRDIVRVKENPYRMKVVEHVMMAFFYSSPDIVNRVTDKQPRSSADILSKDFLALVKENFKTERQLKFYADRLCITPRYMSRVVKECSGCSAAEWIERSVILEARALLKSTDMTIQQISDELNFPSQTFFGKYFKRRVGMSPKEYRRMG